MAVVFPRTRVYPSLDLQRPRAEVRGLQVSESALRGARSANDGSTVAAVVNLSALARSAGQAAGNGRQGVRLLTRADEALGDIEGMLDKMRDLAERAEAGAADLDGEFQEIKTAINSLVTETKFGDRALLDGSFTANVQVGLRNGSADGIQLSLSAANAAGLGIAATAIGDAADASDAVDDLDGAIALLGDMRNRVATHRGKLAGAIERQTEFARLADDRVAKEQEAAVDKTVAARNEPVGRQVFERALGSNKAIVLPKDPDLSGISRSYADIAALRDALERLESSLGTDDAADSSDVHARVQSLGAIGLRGRVASDVGIDPDSAQRLSSVEKFKSLAPGQVRVQRAPIDFDPRDRLTDVVDRVDGSSALVTARLADKDQRLRIEAEDPTDRLRVEDQNSGLLPLLGVADVVDEARTLDRGSLRSRKALGDVATALDRVVKRAGDGPELSGVARLRSDIERAFQIAADTEERDVHTTFGVRADFRSSAGEALPMTPKDFKQFMSAFEEDDRRVRSFFTGQGGASLLSSLIARLRSAEDEVGRHLDEQFRLVDRSG